MAIERRATLARPRAFIANAMGLPVAPRDAALKALRAHFG
jgi:hypothetical protein